MKEVIMDNHTKYKDLPNCLKCDKCEMSKHIPDRTLSGHYGFLYVIYCKDESVTKYKNDFGQVTREFWYNPNTQDVWVDGAGSVKNNCGRFNAKYFSSVIDYE